MNPSALNARHFAVIVGLREIFAPHQIADLVTAKSSHRRNDNSALVSPKCRSEARNWPVFKSRSVQAAVGSQFEDGQNVRVTLQKVV